MKFASPTPVIDGMKYYFKHNEEYYAVKVQRKTVFLQQINPDLPKAIKVKKIEGGIDQYASLSSVKQVKDKFYLFMGRSKRNSKKAKVDVGCYLLYKEIDFDNMRLSETKTALFTPTRIYGGYDFFLSKDSSKLLIQYDLPKENSNDEDSYLNLRLFVFSPELEQLSGGEIRMPYTEAQAKINNYIVANDGSSGVQVYMEGEEKGKGKNKVEEVDTVALLFFNYEKKSIEVNKYEEPKDVGPNTIYYQDKKDQWTFVTTLKKDNKITFQHLGDKKPFKEYQLPSEITDNCSKLESFSGFMVRQVINCSDNGYVVLLQQYATWEVRYSSAAGSSTVTNHRFKDFIFVKFDDNYGFEWIKKISHSGYFDYDLYDAFYNYHQDGGRLLVQKMNPRKPKKEGQMPIYNYINYDIDLASGTFKKTHMYNTSKIGKYEPRNTYSYMYIGNNAFLLAFYKGEKEDMLARIELVDE